MLKVERRRIMKNRVNRIIVMLMAAAIVLPAMAQWSSEPTTATAPIASFQSTSTMPSSGSTYSSTPMLGSDGVAAYNDASAEAQAPSGPRKTPPPTPSGDPTPVGDGVWVMMLMAVVYLSYKTRMRRKATA